MRAAVGKNIDADQGRRLAQQYFGRGTNLLWNRLRDGHNASSDVNIQAVLLLVSYAADFGQTGEADIHIDSLRTMVSERGGIDGLQINQTLHWQLQMIDMSRRHHLTLSCVAECQEPLRFPNGLWRMPSPS